MELSQYGRKVGVTYRTAFQWWKDGQIKGYQRSSGTIVITEGEEAHVRCTERVVIYARVSSHKQAPDHDCGGAHRLCYPIWISVPSNLSPDAGAAA
jgi:putative resolvase